LPRRTPHRQILTIFIDGSRCDLLRQRHLV
jgi:hypothetical protein